MLYRCLRSVSLALRGTRRVHKTHREGNIVHDTRYKGLYCYSSSSACSLNTTNTMNDEYLYVRGASLLAPSPPLPPPPPERASLLNLKSQPYYSVGQLHALTSRWTTTYMLLSATLNNPLPGIVDIVLAQNVFWDTSSYVMTLSVVWKEGASSIGDVTFFAVDGNRGVGDSTTHMVGTVGWRVLR